MVSVYVLVTRKQMMELSAAQIPQATPRIGIGKISDINIHGNVSNPKPEIQKHIQKSVIEIQPDQCKFMAHTESNRDATKEMAVLHKDIGLLPNLLTVNELTKAPLICRTPVTTRTHSGSMGSPKVRNTSTRYGLIGAKELITTTINNIMSMLNGRVTSGLLK
ncbi:hypothetical protein M8J75_001966 [Diaphorina citri]|nr:hypothetical protein M8J75_001966 [Diaphorina citri]